MDIISQCRDLFMRYGIKSVTMEDISRQLGISKKTLYSAVKNKEDLVRKVLFQHMYQTEEDICTIEDEATNAIEHMALIVSHITRTLRKVSPAVMYDLQKYYGNVWREVEDKRTGMVFESIYQNIKRGIEEGIYRQDMDPMIVSHLYVQITSRLIDESVFPLDTFKREDLLYQFMDYHIHGIVNEEGLSIWNRLKNKIIEHEL